MTREFQQIEWDEALADDCRQLIRLAVREDLDRLHDWTTVSLVPHDAHGQAAVVARRQGVLAGVPAASLALQEMNTSLELTPQAEDGQTIAPGQTVAMIEGSTRDLLTSERIVLNLLGRLSGIATLTRTYVDATIGSGAHVYDTRKTTPGWRRLEKYAVRCGGGRNHRTGLFDAILIKDNHLASGITAAEAVRRARQFVSESQTHPSKDMIIEIEVDSLEQLAEVLPAQPDIVLLDNMSMDQLREAASMRDAADVDVQLEASGGVTLKTIGEIARTGVERISVGALTHSAQSLDLGLDWRP
jgi:nicotinate-nucleotide pyrophosphorylase (carboxylating)